MKKGISLIVLVVSIIVMIIIAGAVIITLSTTSLVDQAENAVLKHNSATEKDMIVLGLSEYRVSLLSNPLAELKVEGATVTKNNPDGWNVIFSSGSKYTVSSDGEITIVQEGNQGGDSSELNEEVQQTGNWEWSLNEDGETITLHKYIGDDAATVEELVIPNKYRPDANSPYYNVTLVESADNVYSGSYLNTAVNIFGNNNNVLKTLKIADGVNVGDAVACQMTALENLTVGKNVTSIGSKAFYSCSALSTVSLPETIIEIGNFAFQSCSISSIELPKNLIKLGDGAFTVCSKLTSVVVPEGTTHIGYRAFYYCSNLASITFPDTIEKVASEDIEGTAFYNNEDNWEDGVLYVNNCLVEVKTDHPYLNIKEGTTCVAQGAILGMFVAEVNIPNTLRSINPLAFIGGRVYAFNVSEDNPYISSENGVIFNKEKTQLICYPQHRFEERMQYIVPSTVTSIGDFAFYQYAGAGTIMVPSNVTNIGNGAFLYNENPITIFCETQSVADLFVVDTNYISAKTSIIVDPIAFGPPPPPPEE